MLADELSDDLRRGARRLREDAGSGDQLDSLRIGARASYREAFASLAQLGDSLGDDGSSALLWAMTAASRTDEVDELIDATTDAAVLSALTVDLEALAIAWSAGTGVEPEALDEQIASAFAVLARGTVGAVRPGTGWFVAGRRGAVDLSSRQASLLAADAPDSVITAIAAASEEAGALLSWPAYASRGADLTHRLAGAIDAVLGLPAWVPAGIRESLIARLGEAARAGGGSVGWSEREASLELIVEHASVLTSLDRLEPGREADRLRARAADAIADHASVVGDAIAGATLSARAIATSVERDSIRDDSAIARELRPAWRGLVPLVRDATVRARDDAIDLLIDPSGVTDPGVLAALGAQRRLLDDFALLDRLTQRLASDGGFGGPEALDGPVRSRLLGISQAVGIEAERPAALAQLRTFDEQLALLDRIERDAETAVRVMGDRGAAMPERIESMRAAWLAGWAVPGGSGPDADTLAALKQLASLAALLADAEAFTRLDTVQSWPGFHLSSRARRTVASGLTAAIDELVPDAMREGNTVARARSETRITNARGNFAPALLAGRLARVAARSGIAIGGTLEELALGPPPADAWMVKHREAIADVCRYAEELGRRSMSSRIGDERFDSLRSLVNWRALRLLEEIEAEN